MYRYILIIGLLFHIKSYSQYIDISKNWLINVGDTIEWAGSSFNDSYWKTIDTIGLFERNGFPEFDDFGWVRKKVVIPSSLKNSAEKYGYFYLSLGKINDADQTFFNGKLVGQTGNIPPDSTHADKGQHLYKVDGKEILWDAENQIAVRIFSHFNNGGLWGENFYIIIPSETVFHVAEKTFSEFPLPKGQKSYEALTNVNSSHKEEALKAGGLTLKLNLPEQASVFYNEKYISMTSFAGGQLFFVPASFISWGNPDKITVYLNKYEPLETIIFSKPSFNIVQGDGFNYMQVSNFKIKKGSFEKNSPISASVEVFNTTNMVFKGSLILTLTTDLYKIQQNSIHPIRLNKMERKEIDFTLIPDFSGVYHINYTLRKNDTAQKITGTLIKSEKR